MTAIMPAPSKSAYEIARDRWVQKLEREGVPCPKCGKKNLPRDPLCRHCRHLLRPQFAAILAAIIVVILTGMIMVMGLRT